MAEAEAAGLTGAITETELIMPVMLHLAFTPTELDKYYPPMVAPEPVDDPDLGDQTADPIYEHGFKIAADIGRTMVELGRTRREAEVRVSSAEKIT